MEFAEDDRTDPVRFSFETESPDRDFVELDLAVAGVLRGGVSWFASARTLLGNRRYDSWTGSIGLRLEL